MMSNTTTAPPAPLAPPTPPAPLAPPAPPLAPPLAPLAPPLAPHASPAATVPVRKRGAPPGLAGAGTLAVKQARPPHSSPAATGGGDAPDTANRAEDAALRLARGRCDAAETVYRATLVAEREALRVLVAAGVEAEAAHKATASQHPHHSASASAFADYEEAKEAHGLAQSAKRKAHAAYKAARAEAKLAAEAARLPEGSATHSDDGGVTEAETESQHLQMHDQAVAAAAAAAAPTAAAAPRAAEDLRTGGTTAAAAVAAPTAAAAPRVAEDPRTDGTIPALMRRVVQRPPRLPPRSQALFNYCATGNWCVRTTLK